MDQNQQENGFQLVSRWTRLRKDETSLPLSSDSSENEEDLELEKSEQQGALPMTIRDKAR